MSCIVYQTDHKTGVRYSCTHIDSNNWQFTYYDEIIEACGKAFDMKLDNKYRMQQEIQRMLHY